MLTPIRSRWALLPVTVLVVLLGVASAFAHARLQRSSPGDKAMLRTAPDRIDFWFSELLDEGFNTVNVYPAEQLNATNHVNLAKDAPVVDSADRTHLSVVLKPIIPGSYIVDYRVLSRDGHTAPGRITFTVSTNVQAGSVTPCAPSSECKHSDDFLHSRRAGDCPPYLALIPSGNSRRSFSDP